MKIFGILCFLHSSLSIIIICQAEDTITKSQFLADGETVVSSNGAFELGFFSPGNSTKRYVGMWYKKMSTTVVWVANRETPLADTSGILKIIDPGFLVLVNGSSSIIWSTNASISAQNPVAQLLGSGNLVVKDVNDGNSEQILWQSFDYPSDTFLAGMRLGKNWVTGKEWYLSSWRSTDDPAPGDYTYTLVIHGYPQIFMYKGSTKVFCSGPWNGVRFSGPRLRNNSIYTYGLAFEKEEIYYRYDNLDSSVASRFILTPNGNGQRWTWANETSGWVLYLTIPTDTCDNYRLCGPYGTCNANKSPVCDCLSKFVPKHPRDWNMTDWSGGCVRRTELNCSEGDGFVKYNGLKMPDAENSWVDKSMTLEQCREVCLKNCSCMAYSNLDIRNGGSGCLIWFGDLVNFRDFSENRFDIYIRMSSSDLDHRVAHHRRTKVIIAVSLALFSGSLLLGLALIYYILQKKKRNPSQDREGHSAHSSEQRGDSKSHNEDLELPLFDLATVARSTDNFSQNNKLGEGGFGPVYKGMLEGGQEIAVKRLSKHSRQGLEEFKNEVICIVKLQHRNLVKLLGCCIRGKEKMLIYEYMPNKSLDYFIFDETPRTLLDWPKRFHIINGIARGLLYLHQDSRLRIIHRDLKASNILLDIGMNPKISDFGIARSFGGNETHANTKRVVGTYGYMSPEYTVDGLFSVKSDVFSFGVLVLEIVSGKRNRGFCHPDHNHNLLGHAWMLYRGGRSMELMDESLGDSCHLSEVLRSIHVGLLCVQQRLEDRPNMASAVLMLGVLMLGGEGALPEPKQPGFFTERSSKVEAGASSSTGATDSANQLTVTLVDGR